MHHEFRVNVDVCLLTTEKMLAQPDPGLYFFINQGCLSVDSIDDKEEMKIMDVSEILHPSEDDSRMNFLS